MLAYVKSLEKYLTQQIIYVRIACSIIMGILFAQSVILEDSLYGLSIVDVESYGVAPLKNGNTSFCHP